EHRRIPDNRVHLVALQQADGKGHAHARLGRGIDRSDQLDFDPGATGGRDATGPLMSGAVEDGHFVAHTQPEHAPDMMRFVTRQLDGGPTVPRIRRVHPRHWGQVLYCNISVKVARDDPNTVIEDLTPD